MDLFSREQKIYDNAVSAIMKTEKGLPFDVSDYRKLAEEYGKLLKQFKQYRYMTSNPYENENEPEKHTTNKLNQDMLTGIFNKRFLHEKMEQVLGAMGRMGDMLSMIKIDVDFFKQYNDIYGATEGDKCIRKVAETIKNSLYREQDFVSRYGGEEFVVVLPYTTENGGRLVAGRLIDKIRNLKIPHSGSTVANCVTISAGLVTGQRNPGGWMPDDFFNGTDEALFQAKNRGRNQFVYLKLTLNAH